MNKSILKAALVATTLFAPNMASAFVLQNATGLFMCVQQSKADASYTVVPATMALEIGNGSSSATFDLRFGGCNKDTNTYVGTVTVSVDSKGGSISNEKGANQFISKLIVSGSAPSYVYTVGLKDIVDAIADAYYPNMSTDLMSKKG